MILAASLVLAVSWAIQEEPPSKPQEEAKPEPVQEPLPVELAAEVWSIGFRAGAWTHAAFEASTALGRREIEKETLAEVGLNAGYRSGPWFARLSLDLAGTEDVAVVLGGFHVGLAEPLPVEDLVGVPVLAGLSAGLIGGRLEVDEPGFGDFEPGWGFQAELELSALLSEGVQVSLWLAYRSIEFEFKEDIQSGDSEAVGSSFALGGALSLRF